VGAGSLRVDYNKGELRSEGHEPLEEGDWVSIDGTTGEIIGGKLATRPSEVIQVLFGSDGGAGRTAGRPYDETDSVGARGSTPTSPNAR